MADFSALKTAIQTYIKQNGNEEITGDILQEILLSIVTTLGDSAINDLVTALANEVAARQNADGTLQQNISNEATARGNADTALGGRIDDEATARANGDTALSNRLGSSITAQNTAADQIGEEAEARAAADTALQGLIDGITDNIENGYVYAGIATPSSTPVTGKVFYLALTAGTYTNFGSTVVSQGINILKYNGSAWSLDAFIGIDDIPTPNSNKLAKSGGVFDKVMTDGSAFDISAHFASGGTLATYADLSAALTALNTLSADYKRGGMSIKYVQTSDNKYVQYRYIGTDVTGTPNPFLDIDNWQKQGADVQDKIDTISENLSDLRSFTWNVQSDTKVAGVYPDVTVKLLAGVTYIVDVISATGWFYIEWDEDGTTKRQNLHPTDANHKAITPSVDVDTIQIKSDVGQVNKISITPQKNLNDIVKELAGLIAEQGEFINSISDVTTTYTYVSSEDHNFVLPIEKGQIIIFNLTKADGTNKFIQFRPYDSGGEIPAPYPTVNLNVPYIWTADKDYNGFKAAYNGNTGEAVLSYTVLGAISTLEETKQDKMHDVKLYAYADGNPSSDTSTNFYGWDGTKSPIQRAIDSVPDGASYKTTIFCKGNFKATAVSMLDDQEPSFKNVVYISPNKSNIELVGEGIDITFVELDLPSNLEIDYKYVQTMSIVGNHCVVRGMTVTAKNCRYPIHIDKSASNACNGYDISLIDVKLVHYANDSGVSTMDSPCGFGISSGMKLLTERCEFVRYNGSAPLYTHDNSNYDEGFIWTIKNCKAVAVTNTASTFMHFITFQVMNSGVRNVVNIEDVDFGSSKPLIDMDYTADSDNPEPYYKVVANTSMPIGVENRSCKKRVLKVQSKSTGSSSSVRFSTSSGFTALAKGLNTASYTDEFGFTHIDGYKYKDGALDYHGFALGGLSLDIDSDHDMAARLGDCTDSSKVVALVIDGTNKYVTFDADYTNYTDEQILAIFDAAIGDVADVTLYNICSENFPSGNGLTIQRNASGDNSGTNEVILKGMGVHFVKNVNGINKQGVVKATTNAEVDGIALDDMRPNDYGRVMKFGLLSIWENKDNLYLKLDNPPTDPNDPYRANWNGKFSIGSTPGVFTKDDANGIISVNMKEWFTVCL